MFMYTSEGGGGPVQNKSGFGNFFWHVKKQSSIFEFEQISRWPPLSFSILVRNLFGLLEIKKIREMLSKLRRTNRRDTLYKLILNCGF